MPPPNVHFARAGGDLVIEIYIGYVVAASYEIARWDTNHAKTVIGTGVNNVASRSFTLAQPAAQYDGQILSWDAVVGEMTNGDDQYLVSIAVRQDGNTLYSHPWQNKFGSDTSVDIYGGVMLVGA